MLSVIGGPYKERWPDEESRIIFNSTVFTYLERLTAVTFLYGNIRDAALVYAALHPQIGVDPRDHGNALRYLADLASGKYDLKYYYFDVLAGDWLYHNGMYCQCTLHTAQPACPPAACVGARMRAHALHGEALAHAR